MMLLSVKLMLSEFNAMEIPSFLSEGADPCFLTTVAPFGMQSVGFVQLTETERGEEELLIFTEDGSEGTVKLQESVAEADVPEGRSDFR